MRNKTEDKINNVTPQSGSQSISDQEYI